MRLDPDKQIDLDPSEWSRDKPLRQTILTPEGRVLMKHFAILFVLGLIVTVPLSIFVYGKAPYWIDDYITYEWEGLTGGQAWFMAGAIIIGLFALDIGLTLLRWLRG